MTASGWKGNIALACTQFLPSSPHVLVQTFLSTRTSERLDSMQLFGRKNQWAVFSLRGSMPQLEMANGHADMDPFDWRPGDDINLIYQGRIQRSEPGLYVSLIVPLTVGTKADDDARYLEVERARSRVRSLSGAVTATCGDYLIDKPAYEFRFDTATRQAQASQTVTFNAGIGELQGDYDATGKATLAELQSALSALPDYERAAVELALRRFDTSNRVDPVDSFLFRYLAIDALADSMGEKRIKAVVASSRLLGLAYGIPEAEAKSEFELGRLYNLRSDIAHGSIDSALIHRDGCS